MGIQRFSHVLFLTPFSFILFDSRKVIEPLRFFFPVLLPFKKEGRKRDRQYRLSLVRCLVSEVQVGLVRTLSKIPLPSPPNTDPQPLVRCYSLGFQGLDVCKELQSALTSKEKTCLITGSFSSVTT